MLFLTIGSVKSSAYFRDLEPDFLMTKLILIFDPARIWLRKSQNQPTLNDNLMLVQFQLFFHFKRFIEPIQHRFKYCVMIEDLRIILKMSIKSITDLRIEFLPRFGQKSIQYLYKHTIRLF